MHAILALFTAILRATTRHPLFALVVLIVVGALAAPVMGPATGALWRALILVGILLLVLKFVIGGGRRRR